MMFLNSSTNDNWAFNDENAKQIYIYKMIYCKNRFHFKINKLIISQLAFLYPVTS